MATPSGAQKAAGELNNVTRVQRGRAIQFIAKVLTYLSLVWRKGGRAMNCWYLLPILITMYR